MSELLRYGEILKRSPHIIDVRAPCEYSEGHLPGSVNLPILNNEERAQVGTCYKQFGKEAAIKLGQQLVSGSVKSERIELWLKAVSGSELPVITCFRGGLRSQIAQAWIREAGKSVPRIEGGYKESRKFLLQQIQNFLPEDLLIIGGPTGSGKTLLIRELWSELPVIDLEQLAVHRGSAFGAYPQAQPGQSQFENILGFEISLLSNYRSFILEDESRLVGKCVLPEVLFEKMRSSPVILLSEDFEVRIENILREYVLEPTERRSVNSGADLGVSLGHSLARISKKLGGLRYREVSELMAQAETSKDLDLHRQWISLLLRYYYDPLYQGSLSRRNPRILFKGNRGQVKEWLQSHYSTHFNFGRDNTKMSTELAEKA